MMRSQSLEGFVERLQLLVGAAGNVTALARLAGIPASTVALYLSGSEPTRRYLLALADGAGCSINWLATGKGKTPAPKRLAVKMARVRARMDVERAGRRGEELRGQLMIEAG